MYADVQSLTADVSSYSTALNNSTELQKTRDSLVNEYKNVKQEDKDRLNHFLPSTIGNIELILEIEKIANLHGMPIGDIRFETTGLESNVASGTVAVVGSNDNLPYGTFPMEFTIQGKYDTFVLFLKDLEHNLRLVDVNAISFVVPASASASGASTTDASIYTYSLKVNTYWLK
jgi:Tfp pilus assembly protein PilO